MPRLALPQTNTADPARKFLLHKNKQRLTRLTQVNLRIKKLAKEEERLGERLVPRLAPKVRRREEGRERKALAAAKVERAIERVLIDRLRSGAYGDRPRKHKHPTICSYQDANVTSQRGTECLEEGAEWFGKGGRTA